MKDLYLKDLYILIAEDDEDDAETIKETFEKHDSFYRVELVKNGEELVRFLNNNKTKLPDVVLTDFNMPFKNGYEALLDISNDMELCAIPVFIYSTTINPTYVEQCMAIGARDFLTKPFNLNHFTSIPEKITSILLIAGK